MGFKKIISLLLHIEMQAIPIKIKYKILIIENNDDLKLLLFLIMMTKRNMKRAKKIIKEVYPAKGIVRSVKYLFL